MHHLALPAPGDDRRAAGAGRRPDDDAARPQPAAVAHLHGRRVRRRRGHDHPHAPLHRRRDRARAGDAVADRLERRRPGSSRRRSVEPARSTAGCSAASPTPGRERWSGAGRVGYGAIRQGAQHRHLALARGAAWPARSGATAPPLVRLLLTPADAATRDQGRPGHQPPGRLELAAVAGRDQATSPTRHDATVNDVLLAAVSGAPAPLPPGSRQPGRRDPGDGAVQPAPARRAGPARARQQVRARVPAAPGRRQRQLPAAASRSTGGWTRSRTVRDGAVSYGLLSVDRAHARAGRAPDRRPVLGQGHGGDDERARARSEPVYLAGTPVRTVLVWAPTSGHIGMSVSIFSYRGEVTVGLMVDAALVPDPEPIVEPVRAGAEGARVAQAGPAAAPRSPAIAGGPVAFAISCVISAK